MLKYESNNPATVTVCLSSILNYPKRHMVQSLTRINKEINQRLSNKRQLNKDLNPPPDATSTAIAYPPTLLSSHITNTLKFFSAPLRI